MTILSDLWIKNNKVADHRDIIVLKSFTPFSGFTKYMPNMPRFARASLFPLYYILMIMPMWNSILHTKLHCEALLKTIYE